MNLVFRLRKYAYEIMLILLQIPLLYFSGFRFFSLTQGWNAVWVSDVLDLSAYREHFTPLPPLGILIEGLIPSLTKYPYHAEVIQNILFWIILQVVIFKIICLHFSKFTALLGTVLSGYLMFSEPHDIISSYFELVLLLVFLAYLQLANFERRCSTKGLIVFVNLLIFIPLIKQSFLPLSILLFAFAYLKLTKINPEFSSSLLKLMTATIIISNTFLISLFGMEIFSQLSGKSKSPSFSKILESLIFTPDRILGSFLWVSVVTACIFFYINLNKVSIPEKTKKHKRSKPKIKYLANIEKSTVVVFAVTILLSLHRILTYLGFQSEKIAILMTITLLGMIVCVRAYVLGRDRRNARTLQASGFPTSTLGGAFLGLIVLQLFDVTNLTAMLTYGKVFITQIIVVALLTASVLTSVKYLIRSFKTWTIRRSFGEILDYEFLVIISFSVVLVNSLSGGITIQSLPLILPYLISALVSFLLGDLRLLKPKVHFLFLSGTSTLLIISCLIQTMNSPYVWWALKLPPVSQNVHTLSKTPQLIGFRMDKQTAQIVKKIQALSKDLAKPGDEILVGPNITGAQLLLPDIGAMNLHCRISWWDVCPDSELIQDRNKILKDPPRFILWLHNPEFVTLGHESAFRSSVGNSQLRKLNGDIVRFEKSGKYLVAISQIYAPNDSLNNSNNARIVFLVRE